MQSNTVVEEWAVVVQAKATLVASGAMVGAFWLNLVTFGAKRAIVDPDLLIFSECVFQRSKVRTQPTQH